MTFPEQVPVYQPPPRYRTSDQAWSPTPRPSPGRSGAGAPTPRHRRRQGRPGRKRSRTRWWHMWSRDRLGTAPSAARRGRRGRALRGSRHAQAAPRPAARCRRRRRAPMQLVALEPEGPRFFPPELLRRYARAPSRSTRVTSSDSISRCDWVRAISTVILSATTPSIVAWWGWSCACSGRLDSP